MKIFGFDILGSSGGNVTTTKPSAGISTRSQAPSRTIATARSGYYEALHNDGSRTSVPSGAMNYRSAIMGLNRVRLASLARYIHENHALVSYAVGQIADYSVPVKPQAKTQKQDINAQYEAYFRDWSSHADFTGRFNFDWMQRLISIALDTDGDMGVFMTMEGGFPQLQLIETHRIRNDNIYSKRKNVKNRFDGVQVDRKGRVVKYYIADEEQGLEVKLKPVLPAHMLLVMEPDRFSNYRGVTPLRRGLNDIRDAQDIKAFEKIAVKFSSSLAAVRENTAEHEPDEWGDSTGTEASYDGTETASEKSVDWNDLLGGEIPALPEGQRLNFINATRPHQNVQTFLDTLAGHFVASLGIPPAFFLDAKLTGPNQRAVIGKAQRRFDKRIETMQKVVSWVYTRVIAYGIAQGDLPHCEEWNKITFQTPAKMTIDAGREMAQERDDVSAALMTRQEHFGNRGLDWQSELEQSEKEDRAILEKAKALADEYGLPLETILSRYGWNTKAAAPVQKPDEPLEKEDDE